MFKGIVFDLDGTLVDSPLCFKTIREKLEIPDGEYILEHLEKLPEPQRRQKHKHLEDIELEAAANAVPFEGVLVLLQELKDRQIPCGIFTRNCRSVAELVVKNHRLPISAIITRDDAPAKPDPTGLINLISQWGLSASQVIFVGDFRFDIECGKKAGVKTALFTNGQNLTETWGSDFVFDHYQFFWKIF